MMLPLLPRSKGAFSRLIATTLLALLLLSSTPAVSAAGRERSSIYPDDHWSYSTKLTGSNFNEFVEGELAKGKTVFVRFIASQG